MGMVLTQLSSAEFIKLFRVWQGLPLAEFPKGFYPVTQDGLDDVQQWRRRPAKSYGWPRALQHDHREKLSVERCSFSSHTAMKSSHPPGESFINSLYTTTSQRLASHVMSSCSLSVRIHMVRSWGRRKMQR